MEEAKDAEVAEMEDEKDKIVQVQNDIDVKEMQEKLEDVEMEMD